MNETTDVAAADQELPAPRIEQLEEEWTALGCGCQTDWSGDGEA